MVVSGALKYVLKNIRGMKDDFKVEQRTHKVIKHLSNLISDLHRGTHDFRDEPRVLLPRGSRGKRAGRQ